MTLNRNITDFHNENEQVAFGTGVLVDGLDFSDDKMLVGRTFSYSDTQRYRVGPNYLQLPVNAPREDVGVSTNQGGGQMSYGVDNRGGNPHINYEPSTLAGLPPPIGAVLGRFGVTFEGWRQFGAEGGTPAGVVWLLVGLAIVWGTPNTQQWTAASRPGLGPIANPARWQWRVARPWAMAAAMMTAASMYLMLSRKVEFLYFQF